MRRTSLYELTAMARALHSPSCLNVQVPISESVHLPVASCDRSEGGVHTECCGQASLYVVYLLSAWYLTLNWHQIGRDCRGWERRAWGKGSASQRTTTRAGPLTCSFDTPFTSTKSETTFELE